MTVSLQNPEDIVNAALVRIGSRLRINNMYDGSLAANSALSIYGQTRDELMRQDDWVFPEGNVVGTLLKSAPVGGYTPPTVWDATLYPPLPWYYSYSYPDDALKVRSVRPQTIIIPVFDPQPWIFDVVNDSTFSPARKVLVCNVTEAIITYTRRVTNPALWESDFAEALVAAIARRIPTFADPEMKKALYADAAQAQAVAEKEMG